MTESYVKCPQANKDKVPKEQTFTELQNYYVNKPWKTIQDLPSHLPFSD